MTNATLSPAELAKLSARIEDETIAEVVAALRAIVPSHGQVRYVDLGIAWVASYIEGGEWRKGGVRSR